MPCLLIFNISPRMIRRSHDINSSPLSNSQLPLVVDLDGTLIKTDMLWESALQLLKSQPWKIFALFVWLWRGKASLKAGIAAEVSIDVAHLPYDIFLLTELKHAHANGRRLILATGSNIKFAQAIADHLGIFDEVIASDEVLNTISINKQKILLEKFGPQAYDYIGNSHADLPIWKTAHRAYSVTSKRFQIDTQTSTEKIGYGRMHPLKALVKAMRPRQWLKNLLVFVPLLSAHVLASTAWQNSALAFLAFSLMASSAYLLNDALDIHDDRVHPEKHKRPLAAGHLPLPLGLVASPILALIAIAIATTISYSFFGVLIGYLIATLAYSIYLKRVMMLDVIMLAFLYSLRIFAGGVSTNIELSFWLLSFSFFIFLSLALLKRHSELLNLSKAGKEKARGRGYSVGDRLPVGMMGINSGFVAVIIFMLYFNSENIQKLYKHPQYLLGIVPLIVLWLGRLWILSFRGLVNEDPIIFVSKDRYGLSIIVVALSLAILGSM